MLSFFPQWTSCVYCHLYYFIDITAGSPPPGSFHSSMDDKGQQAMDITPSNLPTSKSESLISIQKV